MRKLLFIFSSVLVWASLPNVATAQVSQLKPTFIMVGSGRSAIASGLIGTLGAEAPDGLYGEVTVQAEQAWVVLAKKYGDKTNITIGPSLGYLQDTPWVGPYVTVNAPLFKDVGLSGLFWPAFFIGGEPESYRNDGIENKESLKLGNFAQGSLNISKVSLNLGWLDFLDDKVNWLPGAAITLPLPNRFDVTGSVTRNMNQKAMMIFIGAKWTISK